MRTDWWGESLAGLWLSREQLHNFYPERGTKAAVQKVTAPRSKRGKEACSELMAAFLTLLCSVLIDLRNLTSVGAFIPCVS